ncbi:CLIP-associated protein-like [Macadamia integrifolia]|uniref:CLIP-associated protein-like n=1 Tax=Macadamia integrifolia TaxID=60698 RepID=UPI001C4EDE74|nr:CLIP-associated protein-like [Macadamia integrifolia]
MEEALEMARSKDTKERMAGVERLYELLEASRKSLSPAEVTSLVDCCLDLLKDNNFKVSQGALQALASAAVLSGENFKLHFNSLVPAVVERLGDGKQPVRDAARRLLLTLMEVSSPTLIVERAGSYAWTHKSWRVREEFARTVTSAIGLFASTELPLQRVILPPILQMLNDSNPGVREAAILCIEEMFSQVGPQFWDELQRHHLPTAMMKHINARLERIEPKIRSSDGLASHFAAGEMKPASLNQKKSSPKTKSSTREMSLSGGEGDVTEKPIDPVKVYSDKELVREIEKIASTFVPDKDWSIRIAAMQRLEGLVFGGATDYPSFPTLLKQLVAPLCTQLSDRRSSIVKQACHLLSLLSKELLGDFEACAEMFIPVLFKLVVITVLVIAESADNCIKTMLRNCKVSRVLPRIADCAKNDRSAVLRARCCEYALLILEYWADAPEIQRSADVYEDLIKCCVADAMSEVRATARTCYRMFAKTWPERSRRLFLAFDPVIQRIINDEDGGMPRRFASPSLRERGAPLSRAPSQTTTSNLPGYATSAIVAMDRSASLPSGASLSSGLLLSQSKSVGKGTERSLESVLHASKQKVTAIESMLRGLDFSDKHNSSIVRSASLDLGVDPPSARDPPFPAAVPASNHHTNSVLADTTTSGAAKGGSRNGGLITSDLINPRVQASKDNGKLSYHMTTEPFSALSMSYTTKRASERQQGGSIEENTDIRANRRFFNTHFDRQYVDNSYKEMNFRDSHSNYIPNFQRPLLRKHVSGRVSASRSSFDDSQLGVGELSSYVDGPTSLHDALTEGLSPNSDWCARVAAFNYLRTLLQQGLKGVQEVTQSFEKVMKLFFQHLDDPHHKVAQAALSTLTEIIPACRKPFESYMERILPHVFSRLIDPKELVRQACSTTLEIVSKSYGIDSLLPALLRSLDEQRSPKAKLAVIEFAINSFNKHATNSEGSGNSGILKLWLAKLGPLVHDKNTKLKEAAITGIISVYSHFDSTAVLNFILSLSVEEQNSLRRALKQYTPRIEVDLMNFLQSKKERQRSKSFYDPSDVVGTSSEDGYGGASKKGYFFGRYSAGSVDGDSGRKWNSMQESTQITSSFGQSSSVETKEHSYQNIDVSCDTEAINFKDKDLNFGSSTMIENVSSGVSLIENVDRSISMERSLSTPRLDRNGLVNSDHLGTGLSVDQVSSPDVDLNQEKSIAVKINSSPDSGPSIPQILHHICNKNHETLSKREALQQLIEVSVANDYSIWTKYFNQILTVVLEVLDDSDSSIRELALSLIVEMLNSQKDAMEDSVEIVIEKLLHVTKDTVSKVSNESEHCLTVVLSQYDPFRCLTVIVPLLVSEDEKTLVTCINCLTKLVSRLSQEELMAQLPSFLPALFDAFGNQSADVRKTVVFCLVDIYIMLGKAFSPYLEGLNSTQLRLVTIYANRISQARTGTAIDANHG